MKLQSEVAAIGLVMTIALPSCSSADMPPTPVGNEDQEEIVAKSLLGDILVSTIAQSDKTEDNYIVYYAESGEYLTMTASEYVLAKAFASLVVREGQPTKSAPEGLGWIEAGTGSSELDGLRIANKIRKELHTGEDFEIRVVWHADGIHYTVYYRKIPKGTVKPT